MVRSPARERVQPARPSIRQVMTSVRVFEERDIPAAVDLLARVSPEHGWSRPEDCESYFREMLFRNPWRDLDLPSWVAVDGDQLAGFYAVMPRPMRVRGRPIRAAVGCQISVAPEYRRSLAMLQLLQACLRGPQDLTLADGAHDRSRRIWLGLGGVAPALYGLNWIWPLRPAQCLLSLAEGGSWTRGAALGLARPLAGLVDRWLLRDDDAGEAEAPPTDRVDEALDAPTMLAAFGSLSGDSALKPDYEPAALEWLLHQVGRKTAFGRLRARVVRDGSGAVAGWYLYFVRRAGIGEVVQVAARDGDYGQMLDRLRDDALREGVAALRGRLDPRHIEDYANRHCWFRREGQCTLIHSRHPEVLDAFRRTDAFLSRMEGEWWLRFISG